jgi:dihydroorotate dehydrogenase (NAD+) catalytic subunit
MLNAIGLANIGLDAFVKDKLPRLKDLKTETIVNIYGHSIEEYGELAAALGDMDGVSALEVNISCPNVDCGGMAFGTDAGMSSQVTEAVRRRTDKPVIVKLSPNVTDVRVIARAVEEAGAHAVSLINTLTGMAIDVERRTPVLANVAGGLCGPAIRPVALYMVYQVVRAVKIPVVGLGGITDVRSALEFLIAGARAIQVGTANFVNPRAALTILEGIGDFCEREGIPEIDGIIGSLRLPS